MKMSAKSKADSEDALVLLNQVNKRLQYYNEY